MLHTNILFDSLTSTSAFPPLAFVFAERNASSPSRNVTNNRNRLFPSSSELDTIPIPISPDIKKGDSTIALARLRNFTTWDANWDGEGAAAPDAKALDAASQILGLLSSDLRKVPKVMLNADGEVMFILIDDRIELSVTVKSDTELSFYVAHGNEEDAGLTNFNGRQLPAVLRAAIRGISSL